MSEFHVSVVRIGAVSKHPDADNLSTTMVHGGYPVIFKTDEYTSGDLAVYVPLDAIVPANDPRWAFLGDHRRIKAKKLRGVFSMGLLTKPDPDWVEGQDVREALAIEKYEPPNDFDRHGLNEKDPGIFPVYDLEGLRRWPGKLIQGEEVYLAEKLEGECARYSYTAGRFWAGSRTCIKKDLPASQWWKAARRCDLDAKLRAAPDICFYGETHGYTGGFPYGVKPGTVGLRFFDAFDLKTRQFLDVDTFLELVARLELPVVPQLHRGPWDYESLKNLANGPSTLASHVREGFVVRPIKERRDEECGRVIFKLKGEDYLLRKKS
jgi:RNA ligase (TIGR02306 family)